MLGGGEGWQARGPTRWGGGVDVNARKRACTTAGGGGWPGPAGGRGGDGVRGVGMHSAGWHEQVGLGMGMREDAGQPGPPLMV